MGKIQLNVMGGVKGGVKVEEDFRYSSDNNKEWMSIEDLQSWIEENKEKIGRI